MTNRMISKLAGVAAMDAEENSQQLQQPNDCKRKLHPATKTQLQIINTTYADHYMYVNV